MDKFNTPLIENNFYHIFNRSNRGLDIFFNEGNYLYFLKKLYEYLNVFLELYAYCLLPNHFHLLVKVVKEEVDKDFKKVKISKSFSNFFNSYTKSINKQNNGYGNLFQRPFKRIGIDNQRYLIQLVCYIHRNPIHHGLAKDLESYKWSSYNKIIDGKKSNLKKEEVLQWFGGINNYIDLHKQLIINYNENFIIE